MKEAFPYRRITVVGTTGSGKSTLAGSIAHRLHIPYIELDALHWEADWNHASDEVMHQRVEAATRGPAWVVDGNYGIVRDITWPRSQVLVWLDYPLMLAFRRLWRRTWKRWWTRELLWGVNQEHILMQFKFWSDDSLFRWFFKTYWRRTKNYAQLTTLPDNAHLKVFRFKSPREADAWLQGLE